MTTNMTIPIGTMTVADMAYIIDIILDEDCDLPTDLQRVMRAWPYLAADTRGRIAVNAITGVTAHFDIDSTPNAEPQPVAVESALADFEAQRQAMASKPDVPF